VVERIERWWRHTGVSATGPSAAKLSGRASRRAIATPPTDSTEFYHAHRDDAVRWAIALVGLRDVAGELARDRWRLVRAGEPTT
jgi:hypothetical protein